MAAHEPDVCVLIAGGGTGGHLIPSLNLARELDSRTPPTRVVLVGGVRGPDRSLLTDSGFEHRFLDAPILDRRRPWRNALLPYRVARAIRAAGRIVTEVGPAVVVGTGGYVSVPVGIVAKNRKIPLLLQEQNRHPGVATRLLSRWADRVCIGSPELDRPLPGHPTIEVTGNPIAPQRAEEPPFIGRLDPVRPTLGVFGGSQGAERLNSAVLEHYSERLDEAPNVVWQTGAVDHNRIAGAESWPSRFVIEPFFSPMSAVYPTLDLIVCRAGAMTLAEIAAWGVPAILVPYPHATADHQMKNARGVEAAGAAIVVAEADLGQRRLGNVIDGLLANPEERVRMSTAARGLARPHAARNIADRILALANAPDES